MARKLRSKKRRTLHAHRKAVVEPVSGQTKGARGLRQLLMCNGHNLLKLCKSRLSSAIAV